MKRRVYLTALVLALVLLAVGGWVIDAFRPKKEVRRCTG